MIGKVSCLYAFRSLFRHLRRTILSVLGVGVGCAISQIAASWIGGAEEIQIRAASESGAGHLRVVPDLWVQTRENSLRLADWRGAMAAVGALHGVRCTAARARANGLLAFGNRTAGVEVAGVVPHAEQASSRIVSKSRIEGRYLRAGDRNRVVIGRALAVRLDVELGDDLMVTLSGRDEIRSAMLTIAGILATGSRDIDAGVCHVTLADLEAMTGYEGPAEIAILLTDHRLIEPARKALAEALPAGDTVVTWKEVNPGLAANVEGDKAFWRIIILSIVAVVVLGIASAQLTVVLERRREFGILMAVGMKGRQVVALIMLEAVMTGLAGAVAALAIAGPVAYLLATRGVDMRALAGGEISFANVLFDPRMYGNFGLWLLWHALAVSLAATVVAAAYPAWFVVRTAPAEALRVT